MSLLGEKYAMSQPGPWDQQQYSQPGYGYQPPRRRRSPLPWLLAGGGVVFVAGTIILVFALAGGPDTSSAEGVATAAAEALGDNNEDDLQQLACDGEDFRGVFDFVSRGDDPGSRTESGAVDKMGKVNDEGDGAAAMLRLTYTDDSTRRAMLLLRKENDSWCVSSITPR